MIKSLAKKISCATLVLLVLGTFFVVNVSAEEDSPHIDGFDYFNYYQLEYVSNGSINTGLTLDQINNVSIYFDFLSYSSSYRIFGSFVDNTSRNDLNIRPDNSLRFYNGISYYDLPLYTDKSNLFSLNRVSSSSFNYSLNDSSIDVDYYSNGLSTVINGVNYNGNIEFTSRTKLRYFVLNDLLYIPAQNIESLEVGFYCVNNGSFLTSSTRSFVAGPIISPNVSYGINVNVIDNDTYINSISIPRTTISESSTLTSSLYLDTGGSVGEISNYGTIPIIETSGVNHGYYISSGNINFRFDNDIDIKGSVRESGDIVIPNTYLNIGTGHKALLEFEVVFDRSYLGQYTLDYDLTYTDGPKHFTRTIYVNGNKSTFTINVSNNVDYDNVSIGNFIFTPNGSDYSLNVPSFESNTVGTQTNESFLNTSGTFDSLEHGQLEQAQNDLSYIDTNFSLSGNSKFLKSAQFVKTQFDYHFSNNEFGSLLIFSLTVGLVMLLIGKVLK